MHAFHINTLEYWAWIDSKVYISIGIWYTKMQLWYVYLEMESYCNTDITDCHIEAPVHCLLKDLESYF